MDLTRQNWTGWNPSSDAMNGDPAQLLRMDNLYLDELGIVSLMRGPKDITGQLPSDVHTVYSTLINNSKCRYVGLLDGTVLRSRLGDFSDPVQILSNGAVGHTAFAPYRGYTLISSDLQRAKDNGTISFPLGVEQPSEALGINVTNAPMADAMPPPYVSSCALDGSGANFTYDNLRTIIFDLQDTGPVAYAAEMHSWTADIKVIFNAPVNTGPTGPGTTEFSPSDTFKIKTKIGNSFYVKRIRIEFAASPYDADGFATDYFYIDFEGSDFPQGIDATGYTKCYRVNFTRVGNNPEATWGTIYGIKYTVVGDGESNGNELGDPVFIGGDLGVLNGYYEYTQVNVHRANNYVAYSKRGPITGPIHIISGLVNIDLNLPIEKGSDGVTFHVNEIWVFRRSANTPSTDPEAPPAKLDTWYRCLIVRRGSSNTDAEFQNTSGHPIIDNTSDDDILMENFTYNEGMISARYVNFPPGNAEVFSEIAEPIIDIETEFNNRVCYLTKNYLHFSELNNPEGINPGISIGLGNEPFSQNVFIRRLQSDLLLLGTTQDIYEISGTLTILPDGTYDIRIRPLEVANPPISVQAIVYEGALYYLAADGIRAQAGSSNQLISNQLNRLFEGHICHGIAPIRREFLADSNYPIAIAKHKLWIGLPLTDGEFRLFVYNFTNKYWTVYVYGVSSLVAEDNDDTLLAGFRGEGDRVLRLLEETDDVGRDFELRTVYDCDGKPRNRKDWFSFAIVADSGNVPVTIEIAKDGTDQYYSIGTIQFDGKQEYIVTVAETVGLSKRLSVRIRGVALGRFKLYRFTIEYDLRPEQLTYIRIPYSNLGTQNRKRFVNYAFMIDTLGVDCEFFPLIDGVISGPTSRFNFDRKGTHVHYFDTETTGTDIGGIICGFFEFYGPNTDEIISEKMPQPTTYLRIPQDDFGVPNRKRHSSYKFIINTRGGLVRFTPRLDGVDMMPLDFTTTERQVVEYFFTNDTISINIGGSLESVDNPKVPFEFYGPIKPQEVEVLPPRLKEFRIPENNYGVPSRKRIRTMPMEINTNGFDVTFTPIVDNVPLVPTTINTPVRTTAFHYFTTDVFGIDYSGELIGSQPFEFYKLLEPLTMEILPTGRRFDQIGPIRFDKIAKLAAVRIRMISQGAERIPFRILNDEQDTIPANQPTVQEYQTTFQTVANKDMVYEFQVPKTVHGTIWRVEIGPSVYPFHRYDIELKVVTGGMDSDAKWVNYGGTTNQGTQGR